MAAELDVAPRLALDAVGGKSPVPLTSTLQASSTAVINGNMAGADAELPDAAMIFNDITLRGCWLVLWFNSVSAEEQARACGDLTGMILDGALKAPVDQVFPLEEITLTLAHKTKGQRSGKVLIAPDGL